MANKERLMPGYTMASILGALEAGALIGVRIKNEMEMATFLKKSQLPAEIVGLQIAQAMVATLAAELGLKYIYEEENPALVAPQTHDLYDLYTILSSGRKQLISTEYEKRIVQAVGTVPHDRKVVEGVFLEEAHTLNWRYIAETKQSQLMSSTYPASLIEAAMSVYSTIIWPEAPIPQPENPTSRGTPLYLRGRFDEAAPHFEQAVKCDPENPDVYYNRAKNFGGLNLLDEAVRDFNKAHDLATLANLRHVGALAKRQVEIHRRQQEQ